jgi:predicted transcriptional regulator
VVGVTRRDNPVTTYLSDDEKQQLEEWADETEKSQAHLLREAILEYLDHDRAARIEDEVTDISEKLDDVLAQLDSDGTHTHTGMSDSLATARKMIRVIQQNTDNEDGVVKDDDLVEVIENYAGVDDRTIRKYKDIFRRRGLLFEHPGEAPLWTLQTDTWTEWVNQYANLNGGSEAAEQVIQDYPASITMDVRGQEYAIEIQAGGME